MDRDNYRHKHGDEVQKQSNSFQPVSTKSRNTGLRMIMRSMAHYSKDKQQTV